MDFQDIILDSLKTQNKAEINEGLLITPFLAASLFKDKYVKKAKKAVEYLPNKASDEARKIKSKGKIFKEKARAEVGLNTGDTVYKLTDEQNEVIKEIYAKYGKSIVNEIRLFRKNVLAPYSLIKRSVKNNSRISSKDITGMTKEQFLSSLESGRKKIEARGDNFYDKSKELQRVVNKHSQQIANLKKALERFKKDKTVEQNILNKIYQEFDVSDKDFEGYSSEELRNVFNSINKNYRKLKDGNEKNDLSKIDDLVNITREQRKLRSGDTIDLTREQKKLKKLRSGDEIDLTKKEKDKFYKKGKFNVALGRYFLRREIVSKLRPGEDNTYTKTYISILNELIKKAQSQRKKSLDKLISLKGSTEFTSREKMIWEKRPNVKHESNNISDYYQKIKEEDFLDKTISISKNPKVKKAEREIENEIKRFERNLIKKIDPDDVAKLKKYRLINNLITVKELENPDKLFKTSDELKKLSNTKSKKEKYISPDEYVRKIKSIATREYDSIAELNKAKKEAKDLTNIMKDNDEIEAINKVKDILKQIEIRRDINKSNLIGHKTDNTQNIDINDIKDYINKMLHKDYSNDYNEQKHDKDYLNTLIKKYKESDKDAKYELEDIEDLFSKLDIKLKRGGNY